MQYALVCKHYGFSLPDLLQFKQSQYNAFVEAMNEYYKELQAQNK